MGAWSEIFSTHLTPFMLAGECGAKLRKESDRYYVNCPACGSRMHVLPWDVVCENDSCAHRTLTGFEFLAHHSFNGDLKKASAAATEILIQKKIPVSVPQSEILDHYTRISAIRRLFEAQDPDKKYLYLHAQADGWMRRNKLDPEVIHRVARVWVRGDMDRYNALISPENPIRLNDNEFALAIPYHASFSEIGAILFLRDGRPRPVVHRLDSYRYLWAGLQNLRPENGGAMVTQNFAKFFQCLAGGKYQHPDYPFTCLLYDGLCTRTKYIPEHPVYLFDPKADISMAAVASLNKDTRLMIADSRKPLTGIQHTPYVEFVMEECAGRCLDAPNPLPDTVYQFIDSCKLQGAQERKLCRFMLGSGYREKARDLDQHFSTRVIMDDDKFRIHAGPGGYFAVHHKTGIRTDITNFIVQPQDNVAYREMKELTTRLRIEHEGSAFDVPLPMSAFDTPQTFEEHVRGGWMGSGSPTAVPLLKDRALYRKYVARYLKDCASVLPCLNGISFLGWNFKKTLYQGPGYCIRETGIESESGVLHSEKQFLNRFTCVVPRKMESDIGRLMMNESLVELTCLILGNIYRARYDRRTWASGVNMGEEDWHKIRTSYSVTGLGNPLKSGEARLASIDHGNRGFVFLMEDVQDIPSSGIYRVNGANKLDGISSEDLEAWWMWVMEQGVVHCMRHTEPWVALKRRLDDKYLLLQEGQAVLQEITGMPGTDFVSPYTHLEETLDSIPCERIGEMLALDLDNGCIAVNPGHMTPSTLRELQELTGEIRIQEDVVRCGMSSLSRPLYSFYQTDRIPYGRLENGEFVV